MEYVEILWLEMKPNIYGGESGEEHIPMWFIRGKQHKINESSKF